jgi:hypothetical protein
MASFHNGSQTAATTMTCARAKDAVDGSTAPTGEGLRIEPHNETSGNADSSAARPHSSTWNIVLSCLLMIAGLLLL